MRSWRRLRERICDSNLSLPLFQQSHKRHIEPSFESVVLWRAVSICELRFRTYDHWATLIAESVKLFIVSGEKDNGGHRVCSGSLVMKRDDYMPAFIAGSCVW